MVITHLLQNVIISIYFHLFFEKSTYFLNWEFVASWEEVCTLAVVLRIFCLTSDFFVRLGIFWSKYEAYLVQI